MTEADRKLIADGLAALEREVKMLGGTLHTRDLGPELGQMVAIYSDERAVTRTRPTLAAAALDAYDAYRACVVDDIRLAEAGGRTFEVPVEVGGEGGGWA